MEVAKKRNILIIGGGFAGIRAGLDLARKKISHCSITLVSNKNHFEYYPRIYRAAIGESPLEVCISLVDVFKGTNVSLIVDEIVSVSLSENIATGSSGSVYSYDDIILALGSETVYFNIEGLEQRAFGFKSISEALKLKKHLHEMFEIYLSSKKEDLITQLHIVIVGGGPSGIELAGELVGYMKRLAHMHSIDNNFVTIDLVEASPRLVPTLPVDVSERINKKLHSLGVNIFLNRTVVKEDVDQITMKDMSFKSDTLIWTAGSRAHHLYGSISGFNLNKGGKVLVGQYLNAEGFENVYIVGDGAATPYSGLAQTAIYDGAYIADLLNRKYKNKKLATYKPKKVAYALPVGPYWAAVSIGSIKFYGFFAWILRQFIDLQFFVSILPPTKAFRAFVPTMHTVESCPICTEDYQQKI